jgi:hypothetical protein
LGLTLISIPPWYDYKLEIQRQVPHELLHILLYQKLGEGYAHLPRWLNEGLASTAEISPNSDYLVLLEKAYQRDVLIPISQLCESFPSDAANFQLAYAEAASFTWYLQAEYGNPGIEALLSAYADNLSCERGVEVALESNLFELEREWRRATFNENLWLFTLQGLAPWLVVFGFVLLAPVGMIVSSSIKRQIKKRKGVKE